MGSVKRQLVNDYHNLEEWRGLSFTETRTISYLIRNRSKLDDSYLAKMYEQYLNTNGVFEFSEPILVTYLDLDRLIETSSLSHMERFTVDKLMEGYSLYDLEDVYGISRSTFAEYLKRACDKIKETNDSNWIKCVSKNIKSLDNYMTKGE